MDFPAAAVVVKNGSPFRTKMHQLESLESLQRLLHFQAKIGAVQVQLNRMIPLHHQDCTTIKAKIAPHSVYSSSPQEESK